VASTGSQRWRVMCAGQRAAGPDNPLPDAIHPLYAILGVVAAPGRALRARLYRGMLVK